MKPLGPVRKHGKPESNSQAMQHEAGCVVVEDRSSCFPISAQRRFEQGLRYRDHVAHRAFATWDLQGCSIHYGLLADSPGKFGSVRVDVKILAIGNRGRNRPNLLVAAKYRNQVECRAPNAFSRWFRDQPVQMQADIRRVIFGLPRERQLSHSQVSILHSGCPFLWRPPIAARIGRSRKVA